MSFLISIVVGVIAGFVAEKVMRSNGGIWTNLFVGLLGGILGGVVVNAMGLTAIGDALLDRIVVSACGAILLLAIWRAIKGTRPA